MSSSLKNQDVLSLIKSMTLFHFPMIKVIFGHKECVNKLIDIILKRHIHIKEHHVEHYMSNIRGREAQFDIYIKDQGNICINVEIQRKEKGATPKRGRYNLSIIDTQEIEKSSDYEDVPESYMIFICEKDYFKKGLPMYHIHNYIEETGDKIDIGQEMIYVNGDYQNEDTALGKLIHDFHCANPNEMYSEVFKKWIKYYKQDEGGVEKMCEICDQLKEMGRIEGRSEGKMDILMNLLKKKLGCLSENVIKIINSLDEKAISIIALNIFEIDKEEDILKYIH